MDTSVDQLFKERDLTITPTTILEEPLTGIVILGIFLKAFSQAAT